MRVVAQRVSQASVTVTDEASGERVVTGAIECGLLLLVGFVPEDGEEEVQWMARKCVNLRVFADDEGKMNRSVKDAGGGILAVSQFTLYGDARKGNRPSFVEAAPPALAEPLYERFCEALEAELGQPVGRGQFGGNMDVQLVNQGPVTILLQR